MSSFILTKKQEEGVKISKQRYYAGEPYTCIGGFAGTGKSTLVKFITEALEIPQDKIAYATFTGKAALVLQQKGHKNAMTLHKLLFNSFKRADGSFAHVPKKELDEPYELIVIDEISMCPKYIWKEALKHGVHIFALGDPFQLPPIGEDNGVLANPHVFLDEVMRQALESDIIKLSMSIRAGHPLKPLDGNDVKVITKKELVTGMYLWADQIICGKNKTRRTINQQMRNLLGFSQEPQEGDKVICLKNYWDINNECGDPLINGMIGTLSAPKFGVDQGILGRPMTASFTPDFADETMPFDFAMRDLDMDYKLITQGIPTFAKNAKPIYKNGLKAPFPMEFDYGYAITCHKSQGSQFDKVLLFEEVLNQEMHQRWLYTAVTRAVSKIVIVAQ